MKKIYEELKVNVISLASEDVIATSGAKRGDTFSEGSFDFGDYSTQTFITT